MDLRKLGFSVWESCSLKDPAAADLETRLPKAIRQHAGWNYTGKPIADGCLLEPTFRDSPYRNSFVPEVTVRVSRDKGQYSLHMNCRPVMFIRIFMGIWFDGLLRMELLLLLIAAVSGLGEDWFLVLIPVLMCAFGYLLCKIGTDRTSRSVIKAIQKEWS